ncbi:homocysteine S-methyltransferase family protein [Nitratidesulfovibrio sp. SRB-5]|uniref:homocysteine S-methyltransferase family protein n=1 Tax=Nitratidesulfovibrio sp. SRB-5 TaxID=2872636 RepID=UPI001027B75E|nr:homocysteine S-methyltransferase family protein [Nitratidesulfovibrio sp. SRB-5]MBZ2171864.1 homocysteine S-methyltransferase family protein [Nitratidesulfovibrio sp. SRB-5]RXF77490.1 methionine synthase [Desulfovibrio sp. DS-1]
MPDFRQALRSGRRLVFDGGMGTMLQSRGLPPGVSPELFCLARPDVLVGIHADYLRAGADVLTTNTFGGCIHKLGTGPGAPDVVEFNRAMARAAREAVLASGREAFVAGSVGPSGHFMRPLGDLDPAELVAAFRAQIRGLVQGGVDLILAETQFDLAEARAIVLAVRAECDLPVGVSMTFENGVSLTGTRPEVFVQSMLNMGVDLVGTNCSAGPEQMAEVADELLAISEVPVLVEPNAGLPELVDGKTVFRLGPDDFARHTARFAASGVRMLGGCCGTTPDHIAALRGALDNLSGGLVPDPARRDGIVLTTRAQAVHIGAGSPIRIIGERINPTGKKLLTAELQAGEFAQALRFADEQVEAGAPLLDVNVGAPMVDEAALLPALVERLVARHSLPLSLDSSNADAIAAALPFHPGSPLVNSISGEPGRMEHLGPLCRDHGAPFILLPLKGRKLPVTAAERIAIIEELLQQADSLRIPRRLVMVDVLALAVSSKAEAARHCLDTIRWCAAQGLPTTIGLSNISFGLPARELLNSTFLAMAAGAGLSSCIAHPGNARIREAVAASSVLLGLDANAESFIEGYSGWTPGGDATGTVAGGASGGTGGGAGGVKAKAATLEEAVIRGDRDGALALVERALSEGADPFSLVQEKLIPGITEVGRRYERREYFLPQLIRSAETMQHAFRKLQPLLEAQRGHETRPVIIMATVEGDIHDIGKNIVTLMLGNHGFDVVDLGKDVKAADIVEAAERHGARVIGLSALMTTTMVRMEDTVRLVRERGLSVKVMVGGAVVTPAYAEAIGADGYSADAVEAVRVAKELLTVQ